MKEQIPRPSLQLEGPRERTGLCCFSIGKCQYLWGRGVEIKLLLVSSQGTKTAEVAALFRTQMRSRRKSTV